MYLKTLLIDLDGVLNNYEKYTDTIPDIKEGAKEFLEKLYNRGEYELILFTTRNILQTVKWLIANKLDMYFKDVTNVKIPAYLHIDDRAIKFEGDYDKISDEINNFKAYWKK